MIKQTSFKIPWFRVAFGIATVIGVLGVLVLPPVRSTIHDLFVAKAQGAATAASAKADEIEFFEVEGNQGLRLPEKAVAGLGLKPIAAIPATKGRPLPPQIGTVNYDNDRLFTIRSRFPGELAEVSQVLDGDSPITPTRM